MHLVCNLGCFSRLCRFHPDQACLWECKEWVSDQAGRLRALLNLAIRMARRTPVARTKGELLLGVIVAC